MKPFNPWDWYWLADDGRVFASARSAVVASGDAGLAAFEADGSTPTRWPSDVTGAQTLASLQDVLTPYGLYADLLAYASAKQNAILAEVWTFDVGQNGASKKVTTRLDAAGQAAMTQIALWAATSCQTAGATIPYSNVDFSSTTLSPAEASALTLVQATAVKMKTYAVLNQVAAGIMASPPTITTMAEIDAAAWPNAVTSS